MRYIIYFLILSFPFAGSAQSKSATTENDSVLLLSPVIIKGYETGRSLAETPVAVGFIPARDIQRYASISLLPSINTVPGVRMEERSPGSYRLNIRGSLLRSPFGVRNVKIYWNDMPFTDAGGNTYINLVDPLTIGSVEILKGPGGSLYGANTGGVVILHTDEPSFFDNHSKPSRFRVQLSAGSYGNFGEQAQWKFRNAKVSSSVTQSHQQADGYRNNSCMRKDVLQWNGQSKISRNDKLEWIILYSDLYYQTPGGLNITQMQQNPRQARPATATLPGAEEQKAAIYNKTLFSGTSYTHEFTPQWSHTTSISYSHSDFKNPFITNYEKRDEDNLSLRSKFIYATSKNEQDIRLIGGLEWQYSHAAVDNYGNRKGVPDTIQLKDRIIARQWFPFVQGEWQLRKKLLVQAGVSTNAYQYKYRRLTGSDHEQKKKKFEEQFLPRLAVLYPLTKSLTIYSSASKGFSPATIAEIRSSDGNINTELQPEAGWNYEFGVRGHSTNNRFDFDIAAYYFKLQQAIVRRNNSAGQEFFLNAGGTDQKGLELRAAYILLANATGFLKTVKIWSSYTINDYVFTNYITGTVDHSGKSLTGVPRTITVAGIDINTIPGWYFHSSISHTSKLPLNDANDLYAGAFNILQGKTGWKKQINTQLSLEIFAGIDNALNEKYSLGNDINAAGRRYFNPAALRNYFGGVALGF